MKNEGQEKIKRLMASCQSDEKQKEIGTKKEVDGLRKIVAGKKEIVRINVDQDVKKYFH